MMIRNFILSVFSLCISFVSAQEKKPNILFIFADDMAVTAMGAMGNEEVKTPHLDRLADRGTIFTHAYNSGAWHGAVCVASRTMLQTGLQIWDAHRAEKQLKQNFVDQKLFWPQLMEKAGYETWFAGKWHVGRSKDKLAETAFNHTQNVRPGMPRPANKTLYNRPKSKDDKEWLPWDKKQEAFWIGGKHWSEVLADDGVDFLGKAAKSDKPFFMMLAFNAPHDPRQAPKEFCDMYPYEKIKIPKSFLTEYPYEICNNRTLRDEVLAPFPRTHYAVQVHRSEYYAIITHMDEQIGKILAALEKTGEAGNTIVIFSADHGLAVGHHGLMGKQNMFDHSVRVPWIIAGPNVPKQKKIHAPIYLQDVMATALDLGGVEKPKHVSFESVVPHLKGTGKPREVVYSCYKDDQRMVSTGKHKLIFYPKLNVQLLFDLEKDPKEMKDLSKDPKYTAVMKDMRNRLDQQMKVMNDPLLQTN